MSHTKLPNIHQTTLVKKTNWSITSWPSNLTIINLVRRCHIAQQITEQLSDKARRRKVARVKAKDGTDARFARAEKGGASVYLSRRLADHLGQLAFKMTLKYQSEDENTKEFIAIRRTWKSRTMDSILGSFGIALVMLICAWLILNLVPL